MGERLEGSICGIDRQRRFCWIGSPGRPDTFCHASALPAELEIDETLIGRRVTFELGRGPRGRPCAVAVRPAST